MTPVRIGVLGCADIATRRVLPAMAAAAGTELVAVASRDPAKAERSAAPYGCAAVTGYQRLLDRDDVDAVYVPLPASMHAHWVERALRAGKHVLAEKPLTTTTERTAALTGLAASLGLVLMENFMFLRHRMHDQVRGLLADGRIGELRCFEAAFAVPPLPPRDIRYRPELGGGALLDVGVYPLRAAQLFLGAELEVLGASLRDDPAHGVDVAGAALLRAPDGVTAQLTFGLEHSYRSSYTLWGSEGRLHVDRVFTPPADHRPVARLEGAEGVENLLLEADDQVTGTVLAFAAAVRGEAVRQASGTVALAELVERVRRRARGGVEWSSCPGS